MGGIEGFKPYVHPDCTAHHNYDEPEVYIRTSRSVASLLPHSSCAFVLVTAAALPLCQDNFANISRREF